jgi:hypothetical protein
LAERDLPKDAAGFKSRSLGALYRNAIDAGLCFLPIKVAFKLLTKGKPGLIGDHKMIAMHPGNYESPRFGKQKAILSCRDRNENVSRGGIATFPADRNLHIGDGIYFMFGKRTKKLVDAGYAQMPEGW